MKETGFHDRGGGRFWGKYRTRAAVRMITVLLLCLSLLCSVICVRAAEGPGVYADGYVVIDLDNNQIIAERNMTQLYRPASTTKIMTALVVLEQVENLDDTLTFSYDATVTNISEDSSTLIPAATAGEVMSVRDVLYGMMLCSGNECANALAEYVSGSVEAFCELMNQKAADIGCQNTHFSNAHGLDADEHYTTPYDLALIFMEAMNNERFMEIDTTVNYTIAPTNLYPYERLCEMGHRMMNGTYDYDGVIAGKTGQTELAQRVLVTLCEKQGRRVLVVIMHSTEEEFYHDTEVLLEYAYNRIAGLVTERNYTSVHDICVTDEYINIYRYDNYYSEVIKTVEPGEELERTGSWWIWSTVLVDGETYYIESSWLKTVREITPTPTLTPASAAASVSSVSESEGGSGQQNNGADGESQYTGADISEETETSYADTVKKSSEGMGRVILCIIALVVLLIVEVILYILYIKKYKKNHG